jgi:hypothetical protein
LRLGASSFFREIVVDQAELRQNNEGRTMVDCTAELLRMPGRLLFCPRHSAAFNQCQKKRIRVIRLIRGSNSFWFRPKGELSLSHTSWFPTRQPLSVGSPGHPWESTHLRAGPRFSILLFLVALNVAERLRQNNGRPGSPSSSAVRSTIILPSLFCLDYADENDFFASSRLCVKSFLRPMTTRKIPDLINHDLPKKRTRAKAQKKKGG